MPGIDELLANPPSLDPRILQSNPLEELQAAELGLSVQARRKELSRTTDISTAVKDSFDVKTGTFDSTGFESTLLSKGHLEDVQNYRNRKADVRASVAAASGAEKQNVFQSAELLARQANAYKEALPEMTEEQLQVAFITYRQAFEDSKIGIDPESISPDNPTPENFQKLLDAGGMVALAAQDVYSKENAGTSSKGFGSESLQLPTGDIVAGSFNKTTGEYFLQSGEKAPEGTKLATKAPLVQMGDKAVNKVWTKKLEEADTTSVSADRTLATLDFMDETLEGIATGNLSNIKIGLARTLTSLGVPVPGSVAKLESADAASSELVKAVLQMFPGAISEGERMYAIDKVANIYQTTQGREMVSGFMRTLAERAQTKSDMMYEHFESSEKPSLSGWNKKWRTHQKDNPLFSKEDKGKIEKLKTTFATEEQALSSGVKGKVTIGGREAVID